MSSASRTHFEVFGLGLEAYKSGPAPKFRDWGGAEINFGGAPEVYLCKFDGGTRSLKKGLRFKIFTNSGCRLKILVFFHEI